jgi:hypothetical protein
MNLLMLLIGFSLLVCGIDAFSANYLESLPRAPEPPNDEQTAIPDEHYSKNHPMAGWAGYKHKRWGGYLDNLASLPSSETAQKQSDSDGSDWQSQ